MLAGYEFNLQYGGALPGVEEESQCKDAAQSETDFNYSTVRAHCLQWCCSIHCFTAVLL